MRTYQDLQVAITENGLKEFVLSAISAHKSETPYKIASDAEMYYRHLNPTIMRYQKIVYNLMGKAVPDQWSANNKIPSRYYFYFVTQAVQYLLGNGVSFGDEKTKDKLGKKFDQQIQKLATSAKNGGVGFGFWNADHLEVFDLTEFVPLFDEENGALRAGIRFWQIDSTKPLRCTLYEEDGYTEYKRGKDESELSEIQQKRNYIQIVGRSEVSGTEIIDGYNYDGFPIVPLYNVSRQSELIGNRETLDAYDLMASQMVNNIDDGNIIYWIIKNAGGMDDVDDERFIQRLKTLNVVHLEGNEEVDSRTVDVPYQASEASLERLRQQLFDDFMALDVRGIASGAITATQIEAAYEPLNSVTDQFEAQVTEFILGLLQLIGIDDEPTYTRSKIINQNELIQTVLSASEYLSKDYVTRKVLEILGDIDKTEDVLLQIMNEETTRYGEYEDGSDEEGNGQTSAEDGATAQ